MSRKTASGIDILLSLCACGNALRQKKTQQMQRIEWCLVIDGASLARKEQQDIYKQVKARKKIAKVPNMLTSPKHQKHYRNMGQ